MSSSARKSALLQSIDLKRCRRPDTFVPPSADPPSPSNLPSNVGDNVIADVPIGGYGPFDDRPIESKSVLRYREVVFLLDWKAQVAAKRPSWEGAYFTPANVESDSMRKQIEVQVKHDLYWDVPWHSEFPPYDKKMYEKWRNRHWDEVLREEIEIRLAEARMEVYDEFRSEQDQQENFQSEDDRSRYDFPEYPR